MSLTARFSPSPAGESNGVDDSLSPSPAGGRGGRGVRVVSAQPQAPKHLTHTDRMLAHERAAPLRPLAEATDLMILSPPRPLAGEGAGG
jgi:hypothetical protein